MPLDKFGHPYFYPTKPGGFFYEQSDDPTNDPEFDPPDSLHADTGGVFTMHVSGATDFGILKNPGFKDAIGGCDMNFAQTADRGYAYKPNDARDIEFKLLVSLEMSSSDNGMSMSGPTGHHASNSSPCCQGFSYMFTMEYNKNPSTFRFRKEMWHVSYHDDPTFGEWTHPLCNFKANNHGWIGLGYCRYNVKDGISAGKDSVIVEVWFNPDPEGNPLNWTMLKRKEDKGGWGDDGTKCPGGNKDQVGTWGSAQFRCKSNDPDGDMHVKHLSLREIDPTLSFTDPPVTPPPTDEPSTTTTVQGTFQFNQNINTLVGQSQCAGTGGGGGSGGLAKFYAVYTDEGTSSDKELSNSSTFQNRKRVVMQVTNSSSTLHGKIPKQVDIPLKKNGSPATPPDIHCKIWDSSGAVVHDSTTLIDPASLTTSYTKQTFDLSANTHALVAGDMIGIEFIGTSSSNYVVFSYRGTSYPNTQYRQYESSSWDNKSRRLVMDIWV